MTNHFNFSILKSYYEEQSGMFASNQHYTEKLCLAVEQFGGVKDVQKQFSAPLYSGSHDCSKYGIFQDGMYNADLAYGQISHDSGEVAVAVKTLVAHLKKLKVHYNPSLDSIFYGSDSKKTEDGESGYFYCWSQQVSAMCLSDIIEKEMEVLVKHEKRI